ncbi:MAG: disulfide oxidoreductase [Nanoarchaeota archaeon]|nr:disulfide oxidoreductase [Nanoarchaeota archaeon]
MKVTKDTTLAEVLKINGSEKILSKFQVPCLGCAMAQMEMDTLKLGDICNMYGLDLDKLLKELNTISKNV